MSRKMVTTAKLEAVSEPMRCGYLASYGELSGHINFSLCLCIFIIMDFIAVNNSQDKYKMSCRGKQDSRSTQALQWLCCNHSSGQLFSFSVVQCTLSLASFTSNEMLNFVFRFSFSQDISSRSFGLVRLVHNLQFSRTQNCRCENINFG